MKKLMFLLPLLCFLLAGCVEAAERPQQPANVAEAPAAVTATEVEAEVAAATEVEAAVKIYPLPESIMDNLSDAILSVSLEEGGAYVDDTGKMQMDVKIYSYDKYDMVDISLLKVGDVLVTNAAEVEVTSLERKADGSISVNGGLLEDGFDLVTDDCGVYYERGFNDAKNWYEIGEVTIRVSVDFLYYDTSDVEQGEILYYPGSFLVGEVTDYNFTPYNTTIRVENGQIVEMHRVYTP